MGNQSGFQDLSFSLLRHLKTKKEAMEARHASELAEIDKEIEAVSITLRLIQESGSAEQSPELRPPTIPNDLFGKSTREACIEIAKLNNGVVRVTDAKQALVAARILKESKNTWGVIYTTLHRSREFEKGAVSGEFRLVSQPGESNTQETFLR